MSSRRFPGKVLAPLRGEPVILHVVRAVGKAVRPEQVVVVTSATPSDEPLAAYLEHLGVACFRGPLDDVFERFRLGLREFPCDWVMRICADSPLIDPAILRRVMEAVDEESDVVTTIFPRLIAHGHSVELIRSSTLMGVDCSELTAEDREHVTPFFYRHPNRFAIRSVDLGRPGVREGDLVVDTIEDLRRIEGAG